MENKELKEVIELKELEKELECAITYLKSKTQHNCLLDYTISLSDCKNMNIKMAGKISYLLALYKNYLKEND